MILGVVVVLRSNRSVGFGGREKLGDSSSKSKSNSRSSEPEDSEVRDGVDLAVVDVSRDGGRKVEIGSKTGG